MSTTLTMSYNKTRQLEPRKILVESIPVKESKKLSANESTKIQVITWEDFRGVF
ncbi:hypothetical protein [Nitrosopumilus maritimus]|uniref:hypothetical protein n=1 Tax=Nitrosopumilus maritimus TaxID=338192 RepID=UPI00164F71A8|nr:hypothetical protein [Nitrosopumilus maritimus]